MKLFKVGDMVVPLEGCYTGCTPGSPYNLPRSAMRVHDVPCDGVINVDQGGGFISPPLNTDCFKLPASDGPVRTVTRHEIVPGDYDGIVIHEVHPDSVDVTVDDFAGDVTGLRRAARVFTELADALDALAV